MFHTGVEAESSATPGTIQCTGQTGLKCFTLAQPCLRYCRKTCCHVVRPLALTWCQSISPLDIPTIQGTLFMKHRNNRGRDLSVLSGSYGPGAVTTNVLRGPLLQGSGVFIAQLQEMLQLLLSLMLSARSDGLSTDYVHFLLLLILLSYVSPPYAPITCAVSPLFVLSFIPLSLLSRSFCCHSFTRNHQSHSHLPHSFYLAIRQSSVHFLPLFLFIPSFATYENSCSLMI